MIENGQTLPIEGTNLWAMEVPEADEIISTVRVKFNEHELLQDRVVLRFLPGAFSPTCSSTDLPQLIDDADELSKEGIATYIITGDNPHALEVWIGTYEGLASVKGLSDTDLILTKNCGLDIELRSVGMGECPTRAALYLEDGVVRAIAVEHSPAEVNVCAGASWLEQVRQVITPLPPIDDPDPSA